MTAGQAPGVPPAMAPPAAGTPPGGGGQALFAAARRRRRRRRLAGALCGVVLAGSAVIVLSVARPHHPAAGTAAAAPVSRPGLTLPPVLVAWTDYAGQLHVGNLATRAQRVVATAGASPADPMILAGGRLYWADDGAGHPAGSVAELDVATGKVSHVARGESVFPSPDRQHLYLTQSPTRLIELPASGSGAPRQLTPPRGWALPAGLGGWAVADGIVVYSSNAGPGGTLGIWDPRTGHVKIIGKGSVFDAYTPPGARYSLLAWTPDNCASQHCPIGITNTATLASLIVHSPLRYGFTYGGAFSRGAFSPGGTHLAVFVNVTNPSSASDPAHSELAIVSTKTGALQLVPGTAHLVTSEDAGWARWLPDGRQLIAGAESGTYAVDARTLATRPLSFFRDPAQAITDSGDINFSATLLPASR